MTWEPVAGRRRTTVELIYTVGGFRAGGFRDIPTSRRGAPRQLARLKALVETGRPDRRIGGKTVNRGDRAERAENIFSAISAPSAVKRGHT